jgi:type I site-specific restriction endonuclease
VPQVRRNESSDQHVACDRQYPPDFFDFIVIDECHRGGANDESSWRDILEYFSPAVQLGLTATPKRKDNVDTYKYFSEPVYVYSLKEGNNDGFLTPFKVKQIATTLLIRAAPSGGVRVSAVSELFLVRQSERLAF